MYNILKRKTRRRIEGLCYSPQGRGSWGSREEVRRSFGPFGEATQRHSQDPRPVVHATFCLGAIIPHNLHIYNLLHCQKFATWQAACPPGLSTLHLGDMQKGCVTAHVSNDSGVFYPHPTVNQFFQQGLAYNTIRW